MIKVLDHGYVEIVEAYGSDERIIEAARMSTDKGFLGWGRTLKCVECGHQKPDGPDDSLSGIGGYGFGTACFRCATGFYQYAPGDENLLAYLWKNKHATPFEMAGLVIEVQAPIFVFREWHRHRTQSYNEMSARYIPLPDVNYVPSIERLMMGASTTNKQAATAAGARVLTENQAIEYRQMLEGQYRNAEALYGVALKAGIPKELARVHLPVGRYSKMRASANLRNWLAFLTLRMDPAAQWEIRQFANAVGEIIAEQFPRTWELFEAGRKK